ncbi:MAG: hypothetical protein J0L69_14210 [Bacteroidetes bacterium]|nr:hypothetical protein [Bacteroidota bacterium]
MANNNDLEALTQILTALKGLDEDRQKRTLQAVATFLGISIVEEGKNSHVKQHSNHSNSKSEISFSENRSITPKDFLRDKAPKTDIERIACLAYYLTHYRDTPHFKTVDLSTLNTEAAQPKLSNPTVAVDNATKSGLLVQAVKGSKQISAAGELFVQALPDRDAAKASIANLKIKRKTRRNSQKNSNNNNGTDNT